MKLFKEEISRMGVILIIGIIAIFSIPIALLIYYTIENISLTYIICCFGLVICMTFYVYKAFLRDVYENTILFNVNGKKISNIGLYSNMNDKLKIIKVIIDNQKHFKSFKISIDKLEKEYLSVIVEAQIFNENLLNINELKQFIKDTISSEIFKEYGYKVNEYKFDLFKRWN